jgi:hypothetical protein
MLELIPAKMREPLGEKASAVNVPSLVGLGNRMRNLLVPTAHSTISLLLHDAKCTLSEEKAKQIECPECPLNGLPTGVPVSPSQTRTLESLPPDTIYLPSAEKTRAVVIEGRLFLCTLQVAVIFPSSTSMIQSVEAPPVTIFPVVGENTAQVITPVWAGIIPERGSAVRESQI